MCILFANQLNWTPPNDTWDEIINRNGKKILHIHDETGTSGGIIYVMLLLLLLLVTGCSGTDNKCN